jgi:hypothetical protein
VYPVIAAYGTLEAVRRHVRERDATQTQDDMLLLQALRDVTRRIDADYSANAPYMPAIETRYFDALPLGAGGQVSANELLLFAPLLEVTTLTNGDGAVIQPAEYQLHPRGQSPAISIRLNPSGVVHWDRPVNGDPVASIAVTGVWGYHAAYAQAWIPSGDSIATGGGINTTATSFAVADADGPDGWGRTPRFSPGQLLRIGAEYMALVAVSMNTLTVVRGQRGSTAAAHSTGAAIAVWQPDEAIGEACVEWAAYVYQRQGRYQDTTVDVAGVGANYPKDIPPRVAGLLARFRQRHRMLAV